MKTYTIADIRSLNPCYDPTQFLPEDWQGMALDILRVETCPPQDRLWVVLHWLDERTKRLFAVWCTRQALNLVGNPDPRSVAACAVAERFACGWADQQELAAAWDAAAYAAADAIAAADAWKAAVAAAYAAAAAAAVDADAWEATAAAADAAADAAVDANAAAAAANADAYVYAANAAAAAAAARQAQIQHLIEMLEEEQPIAYG